MKFNLKTIKAKLDAHFERQDIVTFDDLQSEIDGFEKELREMQNVYPKKEHRKLAVVYIRDILGEEAK